MVKVNVKRLRLAEPGSRTRSSDYSSEMQPYAFFQLDLDFNSRHSPSWYVIWSREALKYLLIPSKVCTEFQRHPNAPRCMSALYIPYNPPLKHLQGRERSPENSSERYSPLASILPCSTATNTSQRENVPVPSLPLQPPPLLTIPPRPFQKSQRRQERGSKRD